MKRFILTALLAALPCAAASNALVDGRIAVIHERPHVAHRVWYASLGVLAAGQFADAFSSIGGRELNPTLRSGNGTFSPVKGFSLKGAIVGGASIIEILTNRNCEHDKFYSVINFSLGSLGAIAAIHNVGVNK